jgi:glycosyltransferase involved in cell wall biosynthesis
MKQPRIALVYDRINKFGGAERVLMAMHEIWPEAPLYTAVYDRNRARWADGFMVHPSFLNHVPFARRHHEWFAWLTPMAFETFRFDGFDIVISVTSAEAKNIITQPGTLHICYCLTPTRYLWSGFDAYAGSEDSDFSGSLLRRGLKSGVGVLRRWDTIASSRPDIYIAISERIAGRIRKYYSRDVYSVIYPPVDVASFRPDNKRTSGKKEPYYLLVSRLVGYKRIDVVVEAFNRLGWPLVIVGDGNRKKSLMAMAKSNITFAGTVSESQLAGYYANCTAFVYAGDEDFGIVAVEAQASGKPVIAYRESGIAEIVLPGKTGELFDEQSPESLIRALKTAQNQWYDISSCISQAEKFSKARFRTKMKETVQTVYNTFI